MRSASSRTSSSIAAEVGVLLPHVIHQPARRGDDDVDAGLERALLHAHLDAAVDRGAGDVRVVGEAVDLVLDLHRELARRREDQHAAFAAGSASPASGSAVRASSAPCRCVSSHCSVGTTNAAVLPVPVSAHAIRSLAAERQRNHRGLNRPRVAEAEIADAFEQPRVEVERRERHRRGVAPSIGSSAGTPVDGRRRRVRGAAVRGPRDCGRPRDVAGAGRGWNGVLIGCVRVQTVILASVRGR